MRLKLIRFFQRPEHQGFAEPKPAKSFIPDWYKKAEKSYVDSSGHTQSGLKTCVPYLDGLTAGYMLSTPVDIYVNEKPDSEDTLQIRWDGPAHFQDFVVERSSLSGSTMPRPAGHYPNHMVWRGYWSIKTPRGYSLLFTHPLNRHDLPFTTLSGIIDSDKFFASGNIPFFVKRGFSGIIPAGTPIAQLIPIKRNKWSSIVNDPYLTDKDPIQAMIITNKENSYKKRFWERKSYD